MAALEDDETQKNGFVLISFNLGSNPVIDPYSFTKKLGGLEKALLGRTVGIHYCYDNMILRPFIALFMLVVGRHVRARFRPHYGES